MSTLSHDGEVAVLDLGDTENRWHPDLLAPVRHEAIKTLHGKVRSAPRSGEAVPV